MPRHPIQGIPGSKLRSGPTITQILAAETAQAAQKRKGKRRGKRKGANPA